MLSLQTIANIEGFLLSDRITVKGNELMVVANIVVELQAEKQRLQNAARVIPTLVPKDEKKVEDQTPPKFPKEVLGG